MHKSKYQRKESATLKSMRKKKVMSNHQLNFCSTYLKKTTKNIRRSNWRG